MSDVNGAGTLCAATLPCSIVREPDAAIAFDHHTPTASRGGGGMVHPWRSQLLTYPRALQSASIGSMSAGDAETGPHVVDVSVRVIAGAPVALVDHARAERPGLDQVQRDVFGDRRQERGAATDNDRMAEHAQLVDEAELDRRRGQPGAAD